MNEGNYIKNFKIITLLGKGLNGSVFLVEDNEKQLYALKIEQIDIKDLNNDNSQIKREIEFSNHFTNKYPKQFMKILSYQNDKCDYVHELTPERWNLMTTQMYEYYQNLFKSEYCSIKLTNVVDDVLFNIIYDLSNKRIIYELLIQVVYIAYIIQLDGYCHRDFKPKNIGIMYTKEEYIHILNKQIPTNKYMLQAIDYGNVIHKKYKNDNDFYISFDKIILKIMLKKITEYYPNIDVSEPVVIDKKYSEKLKSYNYAKNKQYKYFEQILYKIIYFEEYKQQLNIKNTKIQLFEFISITQLKYLIKHYDDLHKILTYLIKSY